MTESPNTVTPRNDVSNNETSKAGKDNLFLHPVLEKMAEEAVRLKAADIFISPGFPPAWKIDGKTMPALTKPLTAIPSSPEMDHVFVSMRTMNRAE